MNQKVVVYNEDYITNLLATKAEENTYLEFKRADSLIIHPNNKSKNLEEIKNEIAKDVSAFVLTIEPDTTTTSQAPSLI